MYLILFSNKMPNRTIRASQAIVFIGLCCPYKVLESNFMRRIHKVHSLLLTIQMQKRYIRQLDLSIEHLCPPSTLPPTPSHRHTVNLQYFTEMNKGLLLCQKTRHKKVDHGQGQFFSHSCQSK